ncbi:hypothetical protein [Exiguobacterium oxidotolerans]|uniref:hypothetical protein n=1 Tax=Exiguobacterium oxidotolerans TaxID=223958 RepID=UPI00068EC85D|nr:hypothetical protein [Exiguobacterium oxidotolerans]
MSRFVKGMLFGFGLILGTTIILGVFFIRSMQPDAEQEKIVKRQAEAYLEQHYEEAEVVDVYFDNMGNHVAFDYAAQVIDRKTGIEFLVYLDQSTNKVVDTYYVEQWTADVVAVIQPSVGAVFGNDADYLVHFDEESVMALNLQPGAEVDYRDTKLQPTIRITLHRKQQTTDKKRLNNLSTTLQSNNYLSHGKIQVEYVDEDGEVFEGGEELQAVF